MFTELAAKTGHFDHLLLCQPNVEVHEALRRAAGSSGTVATRLAEPGFLTSDQRLDAIVVIRVLEHLLDPLDVLTQLRARSHPDTVLLVTHDEGSAMARALGPRWPPYSLQYPQLFRPSSIRVMLERAGFRVFSSTKTVNWFPVGYLVCHALFAFGRKSTTALPDGPGVPLRLGNIATLARPFPAP